jgi:hypothetical protein
MACSKDGPCLRVQLVQPRTFRVVLREAPPKLKALDIHPPRHEFASMDVTSWTRKSIIKL